jgi:hypothetical protein
MRNAIAIELDELGFDHNPRTPAADPVVAPRKARVAAIVPREITAPPVAARPNQDELEAHVRFVLHQLQEDIGVPIEVGRRETTGEVFIDGSDATPEQAQQIRQALPDVPFESASPNSAAAPFTPAMTLESQPGTRLEKIPLLDEKLPDPRTRTEFGNAAIEESHRALLRAYALRNLMKTYSPELLLRLSSQARSEIADVANDHQHALVSILEQLSSRFAPVLPACTAPPAPQGPVSADTVLGSVSEVDLEINVLFGGARTTLAADGAVARLACALDAARRSSNELPEIPNR